MERTKIVRSFLMGVAGIAMAAGGLVAMYQFDKTNNVISAYVMCKKGCASDMPEHLSVCEVHTSTGGWESLNEDCNENSRDDCVCSGAAQDSGFVPGSCKCTYKPELNCATRACGQPEVIGANGRGGTKTCPATASCCLTKCDDVLECGETTNGKGCSPAKVICGSLGGGCPTGKECQANKCVAVPVDGVLTWGDCSVDCGGGTQTATCTPPLNNGAACGPTSRACNTDPCPTPVDGVWSAWRPDPCPASCTQTRICTPPQNGGVACPGSSRQFCTGGSCVASPTTAPDTSVCNPSTNIYRCTPGIQTSIDKCTLIFASNKYEWAQTFNCSTVGLAAAVAFCGTCSGTSPIPPTTCTPACNTAAGETCENGVCKPAAVTTTCIPACNTAAGEICENGVCKPAAVVKTCTPACNTAAGEICEKGVCKPDSTVVPASPKAAATTKAATSAVWQCKKADGTVAKANDSCVGALSVCGWNGTNYCYCESNVFVFNNDLTRYCKKCLSSESKTGVCNCSYVDPNTNAVVPVPFEKSYCGSVFTMPGKNNYFANVAYTCAIAGSTRSDDMKTKNCIHGMKCVAGQGCVDQQITPVCTKLTADILRVYDYERSNDINGKTGKNAHLKTDGTCAKNDDECETIKTFIEDMNAKYGSSFVVNIAKKSEINQPFGSKHDYLFTNAADPISCSDKDRPVCLGDEGPGNELREAYICRPSKYVKAVDTTGCLVWDWVNGVDRSCDLKNGKYCEYNVVGTQEIPTGNCAKAAVVETTCSENGIEGEAGDFECIGSDVKACGADGGWMKVLDCKANADCEAAKAKPGCAKAVVVEKCTVDSENCGLGEYCIFENLGATEGICGKDGCSSAFNDNKTFARNAIVCGKNGKSQQCLASGWEVTPTGDCLNQDQTCDKATGLCSGETPGKADCSSKPQPCSMAGGCEACGDGWECVARQNITEKTLTAFGFTFKYSDVSSMASAMVCAPKKSTPVDPVVETAGDFKIEQCSAYYNATGACVSCTTSKPFNTCEIQDGTNGKKYTVSGGGTKKSFEKCVNNTGLGVVADSKKTANQDVTTTFYVKCSKLNPSETTPTTEATCTGTPGAANSYNPESPNNPDSEKNPDNQKKTEEELRKAEEEKQNKIAPTVSVTEPTGTVDVKSKDLKAITNIKSTCTYTDSASGNSVSGMVMTSGGDGLQHSATLNSLGSNLSNCKATHNVTVTCKNAAATAAATTATGTGQTSFTVDLSKNVEFAPTPSSAMDKAEYDIANPDLKVTTNQPADCEYKEGSSFVFGGGTRFESTGSYSHTTPLKSLVTKDYDYYVVCRDKETCASKEPLLVEFKVVLGNDPLTAPVIENLTPVVQNIANPTLSVTTSNVPSTCQYKKDTTFTYGDATAIQFANDTDYSHTTPLAAYADGSYNFYVACKNKSTGAMKTYGNVITTQLARSGQVGPVISNTTGPNQTISTPTLSIATLAPATCKYKKDVTFLYEDATATQFTTDGGTAHSVILPPLADGPQTFYVVCSANGIANATATQILFTVSTASEVCASFNSNDRQNDNERNVENDDDTDSEYPWRAIEAGTREEFTKVDWYAGYQFTMKEDGQINQLCGYFNEDSTNKVILYNSSLSPDRPFIELASATIMGTGDWKCVNISPFPVKTDQTFYVVARVEDGPIYYEYESGLLPRESDSVVITWGVRQLAADGKFGKNLVKRDYLMFGLVDVRIKTAQTNTDGPAVSSPLPVGSVPDADTKISVETNIDATCRYSREDVDYTDMKYTFGKTSAKLHEQKVCNLDSGPFTFYVRCKGATGENNASTPVQFEVD